MGVRESGGEPMSALRERVKKEKESLPGFWLHLQLLGARE